jgi:hypothetical protein
LCLEKYRVLGHTITGLSVLIDGKLSIYYPYIMEKKPKFKPNSKLRLMDQVRQVLRYHHYSYKAEQTYPQCCINNMAKNIQWSIIIADITMKAPFSGYPLCEFKGWGRSAPYGVLAPGSHGTCRCEDHRNIYSCHGKGYPGRG